MVDKHQQSENHEGRSLLVDCVSDDNKSPSAKKSCAAAPVCHTNKRLDQHNDLEVVFDWQVQLQQRAGKQLSGHFDRLQHMKAIEEIPALYVNVPQNREASAGKDSDNLDWSEYEGEMDYCVFICFITVSLCIHNTNTLQNICVHHQSHHSV